MDKWKQLGPTVVPEGQTYSPVRINVTGRITAIVIHPKDPNTIYVGTAQGGIWKTINGGKHWTPTSDNADSLAIGALAMDPNNPEVLYAGTGEGNFAGTSQYGRGILKTTNGGQTWDLKAIATFSNDRFFSIAINPGNSDAVKPTESKYIFAATRSGIYRSIDAGESWSRLSNAMLATDFVLDPRNPNTAYAALGNGIYRTTNATEATPEWNRLTNGLPTSGFTRIALGISPSSPQIVYALMSGPWTENINTTFLINQFYSTTNGGNSWNRIPLPLEPDYQGNDIGENIGIQGNYNLNVAVDPTTSDIVYLSGVSIWKAVRDASSDQWTIRNVGRTIHADNHAFAFDPTDHLKIYTGNDGGIYRSDNGGSTWDDSINKGLCITQFEFMEQDPKDEKRIIAGTQDNGTVIYEGKPEFYFSADGDGGFVCIDPNNSQNVWHTHFKLSPEFSSQGGKGPYLNGKYQTWQLLYQFSQSSDQSKLEDLRNYASNFYPPMTLDKTNPNNIAIGGQILYLDYAQGKGKWSDRINLDLPVDRDSQGNNVQDLISAINFVNSNLLYVGTNHGRVYCVTRIGNYWRAKAIHKNPFPTYRYIWDISTLPSDQKKIIVVVSGFDSPHVFLGEVSQDNSSAIWADLSGDEWHRLPDTPVNALAIDENNENIMYIGTDVGVFCTRNGGMNWMSFSRGLPVCQVYDLRLNSSKGLLTAATHGRGMWQWSENTDPVVIPFADGRLSLFRVYPTKERFYYKIQNADLSWNPSPTSTNTYPETGKWYELSYGYIGNIGEVPLRFGNRPVMVRSTDNKLLLFWTESNCLSTAFEVSPNVFNVGMPVSWREWTRQLFVGDPVVSPPDADGKLNVFFVAGMSPRAPSISSQLYHVRYTLSPFFTTEGPFSLKGYWPPYTKPTVALNKDGRLNVFMVDIHDKLYHSWQTKSDSGQWSWSDWAELGGPLAGEPVVGNNDDGRLELFIINAENGQLYHEWQTTPNSTQWSRDWELLNAPSLLRGAPTVARNGDGRLELFMVGMDDKIYHCWQTTKGDSTKWSWGTNTTTLTKWRLTSNPVAARNADGRLELFMVGMDDKIYHCRQKDVRNSSEWSDWESL
jgi:photosystem II stability/assembly factor-like uncharacterized protein